MHYPTQKQLDEMNAAIDRVLKNEKPKKEKVYIVLGFNEEMLEHVDCGDYLTDGHTRVLGVYKSKAHAHDHVFNAACESRNKFKEYAILTKVVRP